jgi:hypothetical protein
MTTKEPSALQPRPRAKANPNWGLGFSLVLSAAIVAAYLFTAPRGVTPGLADVEQIQHDDQAAQDPAAPVDAASIDPAMKSVEDYLAAHSRMEGGSANLAPSASDILRAQRMQQYLRDQPAAIAPKAEFNWLTGSPTIVMPTQPPRVGLPAVDLPTEAWDSSRYPNGLDK